MTELGARRFLHVCYCCSDAAGAASVLEDALGLHEKMRTSGGKNSGAQLGIPRDVECDVIFVYDERGARTSPAVEVQGWIDPPAIGTPYAAANEVGVQSLGVLVANLAEVGGRLVRHQATKVGWLEGANAMFGRRGELWRDATGTGLDLVEDPSLGTGSQIGHLRLTCRDLSASRAWYHQLGFRDVRLPELVTLPGSVVGGSSPVQVRACALRLPDESCELVLTEWVDPPSTGTAYAEANNRGWYRFAVGVDNIADSYTSLRAEGWEFTDPPRATRLDGTPLPDLWIAFTRDPDGIPVELVERPRQAFR